MMASMDSMSSLYFVRSVLGLLCFVAPWFHQVGTVCALLARAYFHVMFAMSLWCGAGCPRVSGIF